jgi:hypothetical protein
MIQDRDNIKILTYASEREQTNRNNFYNLFTHCPIPEREKLANLGLFLNRQTLSRMLFMNELYQKILPIHGSIFEFGTRWGQNLALFSSFRGIYEPYNYNRMIIGFDTFTGFPETGIDRKDGNSTIIDKGAYTTTKNYEKYLEKILDYHQSESPISHIKKFELVKGDATKKIEKYLEVHQETIIALAYFDFDLYNPTKSCLETISDYLTKGSVIGFDELNFKDFPGETIALKEVFGLKKYSIRHSLIDPNYAYIIIE